MSGSALADALLVASRLLWYVGCLGVIGAAAFRLFVSPAARQAAPERNRAAATAGLIAATVLLAGLVARLYAQTYATFGLEEPITTDLLLLVATDLPPWSTGWRLQFAAGAVAAVAFAVARTGTRMGWLTVHVAAVSVAASAPLTGHAVAQADWLRLPIALQAAHVLGAGIWIGGLLITVVVGLRRVGRRHSTEAPPVEALVSAFSPFALGAAALLTLTGAVTTVLYFGAVAELWTTLYGRVLLLKIATFAAVGAVGFVNWRYVRPRLGGPAGRALLRRTAALELAFAAIVLALTAILVGLPQPGE